MRDVTPQLQRALSQVSGEWDEDRMAASWHGLRRKRVRRTATRAALATAAMVAALIGLYAYAQKASAVADRDRDPVESPAPPEPPVRPGIDGDGKLARADIVLGDGAVATPQDDARVAVLEHSRRRIQVRVERGTSRFKVGSLPDRTVEVVAGGVRVVVYASEFSVARYSAGTEVWAHDGEVQVVWQGETFELDAGEHRRFDDGEGDGDDRDDDPSDGDGDGQTRDDGERGERERGERERGERDERRHGGDWRKLARGGDFEAAYEALHGRGKVRRRVADIMLAADVYRMSGHPDEAVAPLQRVVGSFAGDPRAPLAAFTLGRVLLDDLGRPTRAAQAFAKARTFAPRGPLAEDALAREVEAWSKAGEADRARERAQLYLDTYPRGHRIRAVKKYGGL